MKHKYVSCFLETLYFYEILYNFTNLVVHCVVAHYQMFLGRQKS